MKKLSVLLIFISLILIFASCNFKKELIDDTTGNYYYGDLVGVWYGSEYGFHGNSMYYWAFDTNGRFAYLFTAYEPPQGGGDIGSSVREILIKGNFVVNGNTIECYNVKCDDYFSWGDKWRYFKDRSCENVAGRLLQTSLQKPKSIESFTVNYSDIDELTIMIDIDRVGFPDIYVMEFTKIDSLLLEKLNSSITIESRVQNTVKVGQYFNISEFEKQSIPYRWTYDIKQEKKVCFIDNEYFDDADSVDIPGGDSGNRCFYFQALEAGKCVIKMNYGRIDEKKYDSTITYRVTITNN